MGKKYGLLVVSTVDAINIGDYVQALAARQYLPHVDEFVEREQLRDYKGPDIEMIMNAYYIHNPEQWPPSPAIHPLFVSVHFNSLIKKRIADEGKLTYFKKWGEIGCRDIATMQYLKDNGISSYFSGCLTLTLGNTYKSDRRNEKVYVVDPALPNVQKKEAFKYLLLSIKNFSKVRRLYKNLYKSDIDNSQFFKRWIRTEKFLHEYGKLIDEELILNAEFICQQSSYYNTNFNTHQERLDEAERLIKNYASAKLVITSRIHCGLPCLGLETPVIFIYNDNQPEASYCRMDGLIQLFNVLHINKQGKLVPTSIINEEKKVCDNYIPQNKTTWRNLADDLTKRCRNFIGNNI